LISVASVQATLIADTKIKAGTTNVNWDLFEGPVVIFTFWDIKWVITVEGKVIKYGTLWAATDGGVFAFLADVEETAIVGFHVSGVVEGLTVSVDLGGIGATEAIGKDLNTGSTSLSVSLVFPLAGACELIEDKTGGAASLDVDTTSALVVLVADGRVLVLEVTVKTGALNSLRLGWLENGVLGASNNEGVVALFHTGSQRGIKH